MREHNGALICNIENLEALKSVGVFRWLLHTKS
jgi:hypothetical protein